jgi:ribosomal protein L14E/L6E/L27E
MLLKLYIYGYQHSIRSSRKLQAACCHNVELWWLLDQQRPRYKTIADFRKIHGTALQQVFKQFVVLCRQWSLVAGQTIAIDGSKFRAQNSRKNNYSDKKIARHLAYIDEKITSYLQAIDQADQQENKEAAQAADTQQVLQQLHQRRQDMKSSSKDLTRLNKRGSSSSRSQIRTLAPYRCIMGRRDRLQCTKCGRQ